MHLRCTIYYNDDIENGIEDNTITLNHCESLYHLDALVVKHLSIDGVERTVCIHVVSLDIATLKSYIIAVNFQSKGRKLFQHILSWKQKKNIIEHTTEIHMIVILKQLLQKHLK